MKRHKFSLSKKQIALLDELMEADRKNNGVCYQDEKGKYQDGIEEDIIFLKSIGFATEYTSELHSTEEGQINKKGWTITYHGIAFLFTYHTIDAHKYMWRH